MTAMAPSTPVPRKNKTDDNKSNVDVSLPQAHYGSTADSSGANHNRHHDRGSSALHESLTSLKSSASRVAFLDSTKIHHCQTHSPNQQQGVGKQNSGMFSPLTNKILCDRNGSKSLPDDSEAADNTSYDSPLQGSDVGTAVDMDGSTHVRAFLSHTNLRKLTFDLSLYINIFILLTKVVAYLETRSLSVLAALVDSVLDVVSQWILAYTERRSSKTRSSAHYPAGGARLEPLGVLSCAALMGFASFGVLKEAIESVCEGERLSLNDENLSSFWSMSCIVVVKLGLWMLCKKTVHAKENDNGGASKYCVDSTLEALAQDHWNDCLSNAVAAMALLVTLLNDRMWIFDPIGAIVISLYIIFSWYSTGKEQIEQLTGKAAPDEFIEELYETANHFDTIMEVDVVRAYHFGPKFLVELEVVLPRDTRLFESHDLGMELQYEIESRAEVERCFVHIDYESRPYDEHVVSKVPELRERYRTYPRLNSAVSV